MGAVDRQLVVEQALEDQPSRRQIAAQTIIVGPVLGVAHADESLVGMRQLQADGVVVIVEDPAAINGEDPLLIDGLLIVEALQAAEGAGFLAFLCLELAFVAVHEVGAAAKLHPVDEFEVLGGVVRIGGFRRCLGIGRTGGCDARNAGAEEQGPRAVDPAKAATFCPYSFHVSGDWRLKAK